MNTRPDLGDLRQAWQRQPAAPLDVAALQAQVRSESRAHQLALWVAAALTLLVVAVMLARALLTQRPEAWFGVAWSLLFAVVVWPVVLWLARGTWRPRDESALACLDVSIRRVRAVQAGAPLGILLYLLGLAGAVLMRQRLFGGEWADLLQSPSLIVAGWIGAPAYAAFMLWYAKRQRERLAVLRSLRGQLLGGLGEAG
jgi:hypothetical protein